MKQKLNSEINIFDIANYIIENFSEKYEITHMKFQKLIFYIYSKYLIQHNKLLFNTVIEAWNYGPFFPELYLMLKQNRNQIIKNVIPQEINSKLNTQHIEIIEYVLEKYGKMNFFCYSF
ncbi:Panacea domain-containing protein ['Camptotheca acuminata' phytoplasma]|uniref:Panacea domain-containing protein n=1 Tax='Camptotheca acuminata' phytoplasma TaxID=3239192 RepID=UPI00351A2341